MRDINQIRVTWQLGVLICAGLIHAATAFFLLNMLMEHSDRMTIREVMICISMMAVTFALCFIAVRSRLTNVRRSEDRDAIVNQIWMGLAGIAAAALVSGISYVFGVFSAFGSEWYLVPTGLFGVGLIVICNAMVPQDH